MLVVIVAGMLLCPALGAAGQYESMPAQPSHVGLADLLCRPLPGTLERADADAARSLGTALADFDGIAAAHVIITRAPVDDDAAPPPRRAALQLALRDGFVPTGAWTEGLAAFVLRAVPDLAPADLTIVDAAATVLYEAGQTRVTPPTPGPAAPEHRRAAIVTAAQWLPAAAILGCALVMAVLVIGRRRPRRESAPEPAPGPLSFLQDLSDEDLRRLLAGERPELVALVAAQVGPTTAARVRESAGLPGGMDEAVGRVDPEVLCAVARALHGKLVGP